MENNQEQKQELLRLVRSNSRQELLDFLKSIPSNDVKEILNSICDQKNGNTALIISSKKGYKEIVEVLIDYGSEVNQTKEQGWTALMLASRNGHKEVVEVLIDKGAVVDKAEQYGRTALMLASYNGHKEIVEALIDKEAVLDMAGQDGETALIVACQNGHKEIVEVLIDRGAVVDKARQDGETALIVACQNGHKEVVEVLIDRGAVVDKARQDGWTALMLASKKGHKEVVESLIRNRDDAELLDQKIYDALDLAIAEKRSETLRSLITVNLDIDGRGLQRENNILTYAITQSNIEMITDLLDRGFFVYPTSCELSSPFDLAQDKQNIFNLMKSCGKDYLLFEFLKNAESNQKSLNDFLQSLDLTYRQKLLNYSRNENGQNAFNFAAKMGNKNVIEVFKQLGVQTNKIDFDQKNALVNAAERNHHQVVEILTKDLSKNDLEQQKFDWALQIAIKKNCIETVNSLIGLGVDLGKYFKNYSTGENQSILKNLTTNSDQQIIELLNNKGAFKNHENNKLALKHAININNLFLIKLLIGKIKEIEEDYCYNNNLLDSINIGNLSVVIELLDAGANIESIGSNRETPLIKAIKQKNEDLAIELINRGANVNSKNKIGSTPLMFAAENSLTKVISHLISRKADPNIRAEPKIYKGNRTALMYAAEKGVKEIYEMLVEAGSDLNILINNTEKTALSIAAKKGHQAMFDYLLKKGTRTYGKDLLIADSKNWLDTDTKKYLIINKHRLRGLKFDDFVDLIGDIIDQDEFDGVLDLKKSTISQSSLTKLTNLALANSKLSKVYFDFPNDEENSDINFILYFNRTFRNPTQDLDSETQFTDLFNRTLEEDHLKNLSTEKYNIFKEIIKTRFPQQYEKFHDSIKISIAKKYLETKPLDEGSLDNNPALKKLGIDYVDFGILLQHKLISLIQSKDFNGLLKSMKKMNNSFFRDEVSQDRDLGGSIIDRVLTHCCAPIISSFEIDKNINGLNQLTKDLSQFKTNDFDENFFINMGLVPHLQKNYEKLLESLQADVVRYCLDDIIKKIELGDKESPDRDLVGQKRSLELMKEDNSQKKPKLFDSIKGESDHDDELTSSKRKADSPPTDQPFPKESKRLDDILAKEVYSNRSDL